MNKYQLAMWAVLTIEGFTDNDYNWTIVYE